MSELPGGNGNLGIDEIVSTKHNNTGKYEHFCNFDQRLLSCASALGWGFYIEKKKVVVLCNYVAEICAKCTESRWVEPRFEKETNDDILFKHMEKRL